MIFLGGRDDHPFLFSPPTPNTQYPFTMSSPATQETDFLAYTLTQFKYIYIRNLLSIICPC